MNLSQADALWQQLKTETNLEKRQQLCMEMVRLLFSYVSSNPAELAQSYPDLLTDLLLDYQVIGKKIAVFLQQALPYLEADYRGSEFEEQLQHLGEQLDKGTPESIETTALATEEKQLQQAITEAKNHHTQLTTLQTRVTDLRAQLHVLREESIQIFTQELAPLTLLQSVLDTLPAILSLLREQQAIYSLHTESNQAITESIQAITETEQIADLLTKLVDMMLQVNSNLETTDNYLKQIIEQQQIALKKLRELREPHGI